MNYLRAGGLRVHNENVQSGTTADFTNISSLFDKEEKETDRYNYQEAKLRYSFLE
jgi:hypothetical protein